MPRPPRPNKEEKERPETPIPSVAEQTFGAIRPRKRPEDFRELREAAMEAMAEAAMKDA